MVARAVTVGLIWASTVFASGYPVDRPRVGIMLKFDQAHDPGFRRQLEQEVGRLFRPAGLDLWWEVLDDKKRPGVYQEVVLVQLRGRCDVWPERQRGPGGKVKLGWTLVNEGEVISHSVVDCDEIARTVWSWKQTLPAADRRGMPNLYARLAGRVMAHELLHALLRNPDHDDSSLARPTLKPSELAVDAQLTLAEVEALRQVGRAQSGTRLAGRDSPQLRR